MPVKPAMTAVPTIPFLHLALSVQDVRRAGAGHFGTTPVKDRNRPYSRLPVNAGSIRS